MKTLLPLLVLWTSSIYGQQALQPSHHNGVSYSQQDSIPAWYRKFKHLPVGKKAYLSLGGDLRCQYLWFRNEDWEPQPRDNDGFLLTRWLLHGDFHLSQRIRFFAQLQSSMASSRPFLVPVEDNPLEVHQVFTDFQPFVGLPLTFRAGRQELLYGAQRLLSVRDAPNARQSFDGLRAIIDGGRLDADFFYMNYVTGRPGIFDDRPTDAIRLWGAYLSGPRLKDNYGTDFYYLGIDKKYALFNEGRGRELRHTIGGRLYKSKGKFKYDIEAIYQFGSFSGGTISAWSAALTGNYTFEELRPRPEIGIKAEVISGDSDPNDGRLQTLNPLFPQGAYFGLAAKIGPANLLDLHPAFTLHVSDSFSLGCDYALLWRYSTGDGIYRTNVSPFYPDQSSRERYIGSQLSGNLAYIPNQYLSIVCGGSWFGAGDYLKDVSSGKDILFAFTAIQIRF